MASSQKILAFCFCVLLASFGVLVDAGGNMMSGLLGGMGGGKGHGGHGAVEALLVAGLLASLLRSNRGGGGARHAQIHGHEIHGAYGQGRAAYGYANPQALYQYGLAYQHGYGK